MLSSHLILCHPLLLLPPIPPSIRVFSNESTLRMRWPKYWSFSFSISPSIEHPGLISFRMVWLASGEELACQCKRYKRCGFNPSWERSPGEGNGNPLQYSSLENPRTQEPGRIQSMGSRRVRHDWSDWAQTQPKRTKTWKLGLWNSQPLSSFKERERGPGQIFSHPIFYQCSLKSPKLVWFTLSQGDLIRFHGFLSALQFFPTTSLFLLDYIWNLFHKGV